MFIRVFLDGGRSQWRDVTIDSETTCTSVIAECQADEETKGNQASSYYLAELCMGYERVVDRDERPLEILQQWGSHSDKVQFILRQRTTSSHPDRGQDSLMTESASENAQSMSAPPDILLGTEFSLERLVQIVAMQKDQLDEQQKMLTIKTQQISSLQQQQQKQTDAVFERNERLSLLKERIKEKEDKLMRLKSIKALVVEQGKRNNSCTRELESMKSKFEKKEQELATVIDKMEMLTRKLKELHLERSVPTTSDGSGRKEKLQGQIQECNSMNEQNSKLLQQKQDALTHQQKQIADFERRISEVQARLFSNHQRKKHAAANRRLDISATGRQSESSTIHKSTSRYKTLPHGLKFTDIELMKSLEIQSREKEASATNDKALKDDFAGQSSPQNKRNSSIAAEDIKGKSSTVADRRPDSALEVHSRDVDDILDVSSSKTVSSEEPSSSGHRISSHLLMNHFAPRPYESKHESKQSSTNSTLNPLLSTSDLLSVKRLATSSKSEKGKVTTESISDSTEILITDPPAPTPPTSSARIAFGFPAFSMRGTALNKTSDPGTQRLTMHGSQPTETKTVEARKTTEKTVDHVSSSRQESNSSSEAIVTSGVNSLGQTTAAALTDVSASSQLTNAGSGEKASSKETTEKTKMSDSRFKFFLHSKPGATQESKSSRRKAASFDDTLADDSHSDEMRLQRVAGSFQSPSSSGVSQASSNRYNSPKTSESIDMKSQKAKLESRAGASSMSKVDARLVPASAEHQPKPESTKVVDRKNPAPGGGGGGGGGGDAVQESSPSRFPWSSKSKELKPKPIVNLLPVISSSSSQKKVASQSSQLNSPKLTSSRLASLQKTSQGGDSSAEPKNAVDQKPSFDEVDSGQRTRDDSRLLESEKSSAQLSESSGDHKNSIDSEAGVVEPNSKQSSILQPPSRIGKRYVPKNIAAETYLQKLRTDVVDEHSRSLGQLYGKFPSGLKKEDDSVQLVESAQPSQPMASSRKPEVRAESKAAGLKSDRSGGSVDLKVGDRTEVEKKIVSNKDVELRARSGVGASVVGPDVERPIHKPIIPRPVRRRMSSGDMSEDYSGKGHPKVENSNHSSDHLSSTNSGSGVTKRESDSRNSRDGFRDPAAGSQSSSVGPDLRSEEKKNSFSRQPFRRQGNLKRTEKPRLLRRVSFEPLALLLDASLEGELDLVEKTAREVPDVSASNDEGITALHNAICAGHYDIVKFLVEFGCDVNSPDSDGWTPLHCAASCNNLSMVQFLVEHGACIFATTFSDQELASDKCEEDEEGYDTCSQYLRDTQDRMGFVNDAIVYAVFDYEAENPDELSFRSGDRMLVLRKGDDCEQEWWWSQMDDSEGYVPRNLLGLFPRVVPQWLRSVQTVS